MGRRNKRPHTKTRYDIQHNNFDDHLGWVVWSNLWKSQFFLFFSQSIWFQYGFVSTVRNHDAAIQLKYDRESSWMEQKRQRQRWNSSTRIKQHERKIFLFLYVCFTSVATRNTIKILTIKWSSIHSSSLRRHSPSSSHHRRRRRRRYYYDLSSFNINSFVLKSDGIVETRNMIWWRVVLQLHTQTATTLHTSHDVCVYFIICARCTYTHPVPLYKSFQFPILFCFFYISISLQNWPLARPLCVYQHKQQ